MRVPRLSFFRVETIKINTYIHFFSIILCLSLCSNCTKMPRPLWCNLEKIAHFETKRTVPNCSIWAIGDRSSYFFNSSKNNLFNICGFAFPFVSFIACPTKKPTALSFPALKSATDCGFAAIIFNTTSLIAPSSDI